MCATIKLVADRYRLPCLDRSVLVRGIVKREKAVIRKGKQVKEKTLKKQEVFIDGYNILITIISYLSGDFLYIANDGYLRDAAESHGKIKKESILNKALDLLFEYILELESALFYFFWDSPVSKSKELNKKINMLLVKHGISGESRVVKSADYHLIKAPDKISATSDSVIIDKNERIFDLAYFTLKYHFKPEFISLEGY